MNSVWNGIHKRNFVKVVSMDVVIGKNHVLVKIVVNVNIKTDGLNENKY